MLLPASITTVLIEMGDSVAAAEKAGKLTGSYRAPANNP
jgi:hypothetical protein